MRRSAAIACVLAATALGVTACGGDDEGAEPGGGEVSLRVLDGPVSPLRGRVRVRVLNGSEHTVTGGVCPQLESRVGDGEWEPVGEPQPCIEIAEIVDPGEESGVLTVSLPRPGGPLPGRAEYRVRHEVTLDAPGGPEKLTLTAPVEIAPLREVIEPPRGDPDRPARRAGGVKLVVGSERGSGPIRARAGEQLGVRVRNGSEAPVSYGACPMLERSGPRGWAPAPDEPIACIQILYSTRPGETGPSLGVEVPGSAKPGPRYRIRHEVTLDGRRPVSLAVPVVVVAGS